MGLSNWKAIEGRVGSLWCLVSNLSDGIIMIKRDTRYKPRIRDAMRLRRVGEGFESVRR